MLDKKISMEHTVEFTEAEKKIRKWWLLINIKIPVGLFVLVLIFYCFLLGITGALVDFFKFPDTMSIIYIGGALSIAFGWYSAFYHCAYKKQGTILLLIIIIIQYHLIVFEGLVFFLNGFNDESGLSLSKLATISIGQYFGFLYGFLCLYLDYKLREINKKYQKNIVTKSQDDLYV